MQRIRFAFNVLLVLILTLVPTASSIRAAPDIALPDGWPGGTDRTNQAIDALYFAASSGEPLSDQAIWVFCYQDAGARTLLSEQWTLTDNNGRPRIPLPAYCPYITALQPKHEQPSGLPGHSPAYWVFAASWRTGSAPPIIEAPGCVVACKPTTGIITIREEWPLVLFHVVASLEWEPGPDDLSIAELKAGLRSASAYLADLTDGYMAFGPIDIYTKGYYWSSANLRFQAANDLRPGAYVGGIVPTRMPTPAIYRPAATFYGRFWNGNSASDGSWQMQPGYRTIVHEWAHHALFLFDAYDYSQTRRQPTYCTCDELPQLRNEERVCGLTRASAASAMAYHYTASELWNSDPTPTPPPPSCENTAQYREHHMSDWEVLEQWFPMQGLPTSPTWAHLLRPVGTPEPDPPAAALSKWGTLEDDLSEWGTLEDVFGKSPLERFDVLAPIIFTPPGARNSAVRPASFEQSLNIDIDDSSVLRKTLATQVYLLKKDEPERILYQGTVITNGVAPDQLGAITLLGADQGDELHIFIDRYTYPGTVNGKRFIYSGEVADVPVDDVLVTANEWGSSLNLEYGFTSPTGGEGKLNRLQAILYGERSLELSNPVAQLCVPDANIGCPDYWRKPMEQSTDGKWVADFAPLPLVDEIPLYGVIRIQEDGQGVTPGFDGLIRWFRDGGSVGPGHSGGNGAPLRDGTLMVDPVNATSNADECNRVMFMPAANYQALTTPLTNTIGGIVGLPLDVDFLFKATEGDQGGQLCSSESLPPVRLTLSYDQAEIDRLGISEDKLTILHYEESTKAWVDLGAQPISTAINSDLNWVSAVITPTIISQTVASPDGIYTIAWQP